MFEIKITKEEFDNLSLDDFKKLIIKKINNFIQPFPRAFWKNRREYI